MDKEKGKRTSSGIRREQLMKYATFDKSYTGVIAKELLHILDNPRDYLWSDAPEKTDTIIIEYRNGREFINKIMLFREITSKSRIREISEELATENGCMCQAVADLIQAGIEKYIAEKGGKE